MNLLNVVWELRNTTVNFECEIFMEIEITHAFRILDGLLNVYQSFAVEQVSSMLHSARPTVELVAITLILCCFEMFWKVGKDVRTHDMCENSDHYRIWLLGQPSGSILILIL